MKIDRSISLNELTQIFKLSFTIFNPTGNLRIVPLFLLSNNYHPICNGNLNNSLDGYFLTLNNGFTYESFSL